MKDSFLRTFVKLSEDTEIPGIFAIWAGLSGISCTLGRRVWLDMRIYSVFPNLYVVLVAASGRCRKSASIGQIENLLYQLTPTPNLISQKITPEGLITAMKVVQTTTEGQFLKESCVGFIIADELQVFLNKRSYEMGLGTLLIPFFDCKDHFSYFTKGRGIEVTDESCLGLLAGTTIMGLKEAIPIEAIGEGLTSRILFVYCSTPSDPVAITRRTKALNEIEVECIKFLQEVLTLEGPITLTPDAWKFYEKNYNEFYINTPLYDMPTLSGYASRRHLHLLKLATIFAVSSRMSLEIKQIDLESADEFLTMCEETMPLLLNMITSTELGTLTQEIYLIIKKFTRMKRKELLIMISHKVDSKRLTDICETLVQSGKITISASEGDLIFTVVR